MEAVENGLIHNCRGQEKCQTCNFIAYVFAVLFYVVAQHWLHSATVCLNFRLDLGVLQTGVLYRLVIWLTMAGPHLHLNFR